jgi:phosphotransferase system  glucose/maltose/N-acetylglucosamine-specific IIC component
MPTAVVVLVAVIVPVISVLTVWGLFLGLRDLEQSSDDLVELRQRAPSARPDEPRTI